MNRHPSPESAPSADDLVTRLVGGLSADRLRQLAAARRATAPAAPAAPEPAPGPVDVTRPHALSFAQRRLWFLDRMHPGAVTYNMPVAYDITGELDTAALRGALQLIQDRHAALRTRFLEQDGEGVALVTAPAHLALPQRDLTRLPVARREEAARDVLRMAAQEPFDLREGPVFRVLLVRLARTRHVLLSMMHHIVSDGWSMAVYERELVANYTALHTGSRPEPAAPPLGYADHAARQLERSRGADFRARVEDWRARLSPLPEPLELPTDLPRPERPTGRGGLVELTVPADLRDALRHYASSRGASLAMVMLGLLQYVLARQSGQDHVCVGMPVAGREDRQSEAVIGLFINLLPISARIRPDTSLRTLLDQVRDEALYSYAHQDVPFDMLTEALDLPRRLDRSPVFQVLFAMQNTPRQRTADDPAQPSFRRREVPVGQAKFELSFEFGGDGDSDGLWGTVEYSTDLFTRDTVVELGDRYLTLLREALAAPDTAALDSLPFVARDRLPGALGLEDPPDDLVVLPATAGACTAVTELTGPWSPDAWREAVGEARRRHRSLRVRARSLTRLRESALYTWTEPGEPHVSVVPDGQAPVADGPAALLRATAVTAPTDAHGDPAVGITLLRGPGEGMYAVLSGPATVWDEGTAREVAEELGVRYRKLRDGGSSQDSGSPRGDGSAPVFAPLPATATPQVAPVVAAPSLPLPPDAGHTGRALSYCVLTARQWQDLQHHSVGEGITPARLLSGLFGYLAGACSRATEPFAVYGTGTDVSLPDIPLSDGPITDGPVADCLVADGLVLPWSDDGVRGSVADTLRAWAAPAPAHHRAREAEEHAVRLEFALVPGPTAPSVWVASPVAPGTARLRAEPLSDGGLRLLLDDATGFLAGLRLPERLRGLTEALVTGDHTAWEELPLVLPDEESLWHDVLNRAEIPARATASASSLTRLFAEQVAARPHATAVSHGPRSLTYGVLAARVDAVAGALRPALDRHKGPRRVAVCAERGIDLIVSLLAVLRAGAAYVPLDPLFPAARTALIVADAEPALVITEDALRERFADAGVPVRTLAELESGAAPAPGPLPADQDPAYVIYTSGTTGRPKGVAVAHAHVVRLFGATRHWFGFGSDDVWTLFHSYAFDFSVWEIWGALLHGGRLVVVDETVARDPARFLDLLAAEQVTFLNQTPSAFAQLVREEAGRTEPPELALRTVVFGGEALDFAALRPWTDRHGLAAPELVNMYGITETTVHVTHHRVTAADLTGGRSVVGVPIPDLQTWVVDPHGRLLPPGVAGELWVGGRGVALGYVRRPVLTAERFVPDRLAREPLPGARLYRSGDLARLLPQGRLEYLGRIDHQVKIRGYRIELGEIEACLSAQPGVAERIVLAVGESSENRQLVAWVVPAPGAVLDTDRLREALADRLPGYMVPARFVVLDALPLTSNGKTDRRRLPLPEETAPDGHREPRTATERVLLGLWAEVLGRTAVAPDANFFHLGGHSMLAVRLAALIRASFGADLPLSVLFTHQTPASLAAWLERQTRAEQSERVPSEPVLVPVRRAPDSSVVPLFAVHPGAGGVLCYQPLAEALGGDQPFYGIRCYGHQPGERPFETLAAMAEHYCALVRRAHPTGPYRLIGHSLGGVVAWEMARRLQAEGHEVALLALLDTYLPGALGETRSSPALIVENLLGRPVDLADDDLVGLSDEEQVDAALDRLARDSRGGPGGAGLDRPLLLRHLRMLKDNLRLCAEHPMDEGPPFRGPVLYAAARGNAAVASVPELWRPYVDGTVNVVPVAGDHEGMLRAEGARDVAAAVVRGPVVLGAQAVDAQAIAPTHPKDAR